MTVQMLEVENKVSLYSHSVNMARWNIKKDSGQIVQYLGSIWDEAETSVRNSGNAWQHDNILEHFIGVLIFGYFMERICIERAHERIRLKYDKCNPCAVKYVTNRMFDHIVNSWNFE